MNLPVPDKNLVDRFVEVDNVIFKTFSSEIANYEIVPIKQSLAEAQRKLKLKKVYRIVYDKNENTLDKFNSVFAATHNINASFVILLNSDGSNTELFIGTKDDMRMDGSSAIKTFENTIKGNFPGILTKDLYSDDVKKICNIIQSSENNYISGVVGVPSLKDKGRDNFVQGLEKIIDGMAGEKYTAVILASPVSRQELIQREAAFHELYTTLSFFEQQQITFTENKNTALGKTISEGVTESLSRSIAKTSSTTEGRSESNASSKADTTNKGTAFAGAGAAIGGGIGSVIPVAGTLAGAVIGGALGGAFGSLIGSETTTNSETMTRNSSETSGSSNTESSSKGSSHTEAESKTSTYGTGISNQLTGKNRRVKEILAVIDEQLERIRTCKNYGMWNWGTYFIGGKRQVVKMGADIYSGILKGQATGIEQSAINLWSKDKDEQQFKDLLNYVVRFRHPILKMPEGYSFETTLAASLISTEEVSVAMALPQKSLPGIPVVKSVEFGRSVSSYNSNNPSKNIDIGTISYLGKESKTQTVKLDINSLTAHTFITGSTGTGKSNTIYCMLNDLWKNHGIPYLILEPSKGEYKEFFGGKKGVNVYGTNPYLTPVLCINPFSFPEQIHIVEHIDRFIEILNAVWPMYAAMPAIFKEAVEKTYEKMGWDLVRSENCYGRIFPDFEDLLECLPEIIETSSYSDEVKGNYAGALITRVRSLTNGYFRYIFQKEEIENNHLFDSPCIIDLSRVGSSETKALLMGVLFQKLHEYRIASKKESNARLKHITVLEEAHNLLRKTSFDQNQEGANLQGKSVEMMSNAIAEMRTYGEGFIIADQAPGYLDQSVIRNTNTKIILRLPDFEDRQLTGKAAGLNEDQIEELSKLKTGCAAVYQNDWQEPVLCQIKKIDNALKEPFQHKNTEISVGNFREYYHTELLKLFIDIYFTDKPIDEVANEKGIDLTKIATYYPVEIDSFKNGNNSHRSKLEHFRKLIGLDRLLDKVEKNDDDEIWTKALIKELSKNGFHKDFDAQAENGMLQILFDTIEFIKPEYTDLWEEKKKNVELWRQYL